MSLEHSSSVMFRAASTLDWLSATLYWGSEKSKAGQNLVRLTLFIKFFLQAAPVSLRSSFSPYGPTDRERAHGVKAGKLENTQCLALQQN